MSESQQPPIKDTAAQVDPLGDRLMRVFWRRPPADVAERTRRRVALHLIPYLFFLYILAYLDRVNVSVAALGMEKPPEAEGLGFPRDVIGFGFGLFFWGYWILEIPSTISVVRWGARWVFVRILILWGICATLIGFIGLPLAGWLFGWLPHFPETWPGLGSIAQFMNSLPTNATSQFYAFRFLLGFFEGGFFPSVIMYLSLWFRPQDRAKAIASFMIAIPLSTALGMPASALLLKVHWLGLAGWRWIFILEGIVPILAGFLTLFFLPDRPSKARWLPPEERDWLTGELAREEHSKHGHGPGAWKSHVGLVLLLTAVYFCLNVPSYGLTSFMPSIIRSQSGLSDRWSGIVAALPFVFALAAMLVNGWHSDRTGERPWHVALPLALSSLGICVAAATNNFAVIPLIVMIVWVGTCLYAHLPAFWPIPTTFLGVGAAASAIGFINMIGNLGGSLGPTLVGLAAKGQTSFAPAFLILAPWPLAGAILILIVGYSRRKRSVAPREPVATALSQD